MIIRQLFDHASSTYTYLIATSIGGEALIIDPVMGKLDVYSRLISELDLSLRYAIDTHVHADHISAIGALRKSFSCDTVHGRQSPATGITLKVDDKQSLPFGDLEFRAIYTPGHTIESYCYLLGPSEKPCLFSGDTLLIRGTGRTDFQQGCAKQQYDSLFHKLLALPDQTIVYPGHDYNGMTSSTIGEERQHNPRLQVKSADEYARLMSSLKLESPQMMDLAVPANLSP